MKEIEIYNNVRIQDGPNYWHTVEDTYVDAGCEGITIAYHEGNRGEVQHMCFSNEVALAIADAIYKLAGKDKNPHKTDSKPL